MSKQDAPTNIRDGWKQHALRGLAILARNMAFYVTIVVAGLTLLVTIGLSQRFGWLTSHSHSNSSATEQTYTCPMHPQIRQQGEGRCPICGMELVPASQAGGDGNELAIQIPQAQRRLANIETNPVTLEPVTQSLRTIGAIEIDESRMATIASYIDGRIERLFADYTGIDVQQEDHLAIVYSPELYSAQIEYLQAREALRNQSPTGVASVRRISETLVANSRHRLTELGMTDQQLADLEQSQQAQSRLTIYAPHGGTVIEKLTEEGQYLKAGEPIYRIANLTTVWLMLELYPEDASRIRFGQEVEGRMTSNPDQPLLGRVAFIDPTVDPKTRTVGVRVEFANPDKSLRPGDYAQATIRIPIGPQGEIYDERLAGKWISPMHPQIIADQPGECPICGMQLVPTSKFGFSDQPVERPLALVIPRSAVLLAGDQSVVYVETEPGRFEIRKVTLGPMIQEQAIVLDGVQEGEQVAVSGNFLIDSQMQLAGNPSLIDANKIKEAPPRNTPLAFSDINIQPVTGSAGEQLETLYQNYFEIQQSLAADQLPSSDSIETTIKLTHQLHSELMEDKQVAELLGEIATALETMELTDVKTARVGFKPLSHAVVTLATMRRGEGSTNEFHHFFCPMVKGGEGDWLQASDQLVNPYYGSAMLRCGEKVHSLAPTANAEAQ